MFIGFFTYYQVFLVRMIVSAHKVTVVEGDVNDNMLQCTIKNRNDTFTEFL